MLIADGRTALVTVVDLADPMRPTVRVPGADGAIEEVAAAELAATSSPVLAEAA